MENTAGCEDAMDLFQHRWQVLDVLQHAVRKHRAIRAVGLRDGFAEALDELVVGAKLTRALELARIRVDAGVNALGEHHMREQAFAAAQIENRPRKQYRRIEP